MLTYTNGNGAAIPSITKTITGASLAHRRLDKRQRAILAADVFDGLVRFTPTQAQLAQAFGVSVPYIELARRLSPEKRAAILDGQDPVSFAALLNPPQRVCAGCGVSLAGPVIPNMRVITDADLEQMIRAVGLERALAVAVQVEHNA
jgi:hypothetical protein